MEFQEDLIEEIDEREAVDEGRRVQLIVFPLGNEEYALPIDQIKEIVLTPRISKMPQTPEYVMGIANIRGNVISIMDFEKKFGLSKGEDTPSQKRKSNYTLVIESDEFDIGILVKDVPNTMSVPASKIDSSGNIIQYSSLDESVITGVVKVKGRMIIMLDVLKMLQIGELKTKLG